MRNALHILWPEEDHDNNQFDDVKSIVPPVKVFLKASSHVQMFKERLSAGWSGAKMHLEDKMVKKGEHFPKMEDNGQFNKSNHVIILFCKLKMFP